MNIGKGIKEIRKQKGLNQFALANACKLSQTSLSQIENGIKRPNPKTLKKICGVLDISEVLLYILGTEEKDVPKEKKQIYKMLFPTVKDLVIRFAEE